MYNNHSKDLALLANSFLEQAINADFGENKPNYDKTQRKPTHFSRWMNLANNFV